MLLTDLIPSSSGRHGIPGIHRAFPGNNTGVLFWILHRTIPLLFAALGLILIMFFLIMTYAPKIFIDEKFNKEENVVEMLRKREKSERIKKLTRL